MTNYDVFESEEERKEVARYGLYQGGIIAGSILLVFLISIFLGIVKETLGFFVVAFFLRVNAGGYHAKKASYCIVLSTLFTIGALYILKSVQLPFALEGLIELVLSVFLWLFTPVDCKNKPLEEDEKVYFQKRCRRLICLFGVLFVICGIASLQAFVKGICMGFIFASVLVGLGILNQKYDI